MPEDFLFAQLGKVLSFVGGSRVIGQVARSSEVETMTSQSCHIAIGGFGRFPALIPPEDPFEITPPKKVLTSPPPKNYCLWTYFCDDVSLGEKKMA
ncbi:hypothetical protein CDAR_27351 [Caerostris darwini]|uniref:Uncharacterized protein n=1 Tax=Caerostris darwini TaxID=1538125 RepID=A0AAV4RBE2_9ARAC|nr:hypothetical protein CDAR_27351 [Caerostris darwini]